jgi:hypothetical protein
MVPVNTVPGNKIRFPVTPKTIRTISLNEKKPLLPTKLLLQHTPFCIYVQGWVARKHFSFWRVIENIDDLRAIWHWIGFGLFEALDEAFRRKVRASILQPKAKIGHA